jgi:hypothetical protein
MTFAPTAREMPVTLQAVVPVAVPAVAFAWFVQVTEATVTLSEAEPPRLIVATVVFVVGEEVGDVIVAVGLVLSRVTVIVSDPVLPPASRAVTTMTFAPAFRAMLATLQLVVPAAVPLAPVVWFVQTTCVTPTSSDAVPAKARPADAVV